MTRDIVAEEIDVLARYLRLRRKLPSLPRIYQHPTQPYRYRIGGRSRTLRQLERRVAKLEESQ